MCPSDPFSQAGSRATTVGHLLIGIVIMGTTDIQEDNTAQPAKTIFGHEIYEDFDERMDAENEKKFGKGVKWTHHNGYVAGEESGPRRERKQRKVPVGKSPVNTVNDVRPKLLITTEEHVVNDQTVALLAKDDSVFQRGGLLVHIVQGTERVDGINRAAGSPTISRLPEAVLRESLTRSVRFVQVQKIGKEVVEVDAHPPGWCVKAISQRGAWEGIRPLRAVVPSPVLRRDGTVLTTVGYDDKSGLYCADDAGVEVPENPSRDNAAEAVERLLGLVCDFPFAKPSHRSAWLSLLLTPLARHAFHGPAPLFLVDANVRGSGKTLLCELGSIVAYGTPIARMSNPGDDDEARKRITALAIAGDPLVLIDNIVGRLGCASLDAALTATVWKDRILGVSQMVELPLTVTWCASGNNVMLAADTTRRTLHIRLESPMENPELRTGFKYPNVTKYALENRSALLSAALTILRAYCCAGRPRAGLPAWGSFEGWSSVVREAVVWCGQPDPAQTRQELADIADTEAGALRDLLEAWGEIDPFNEGRTTAEILDKLHADYSAHQNVRSAIVELCPPTKGPLPNARQLGNRLAHVRRRIIGGKALDYRVRTGRQRAWQVVTADSGDSSDSVIAPKNGIGGDSSDSSDTVSSLRVNTENVPEKYTGPEPCHRSHQSHHTECNHTNPDTFEHRDGNAYCRGCGRWMGRVKT